MKSTTTGSKSSYSTGSGNSDDSNISANDNERKLLILHLLRSRKSQKLRIDKIDRLIDWNTENLVQLLQQIVDSRQSGECDDNFTMNVSIEGNPFDAVKEIIALPQVKKSKSESSIPISTVVSQLRDYVSTIAQMYNDNYFHNFENVSKGSGIFSASHILLVIVQTLLSVCMIFFLQPGVTRDHECFEAIIPYYCTIRCYG